MNTVGTPEGCLALEDVAVRTFLDGCVEETIAALTARAQLDVATDSEVRATLERIVEDETRHAADQPQVQRQPPSIRRHRRPPRSPRPPTARASSAPRAWPRWPGEGRW